MLAAWFAQRDFCVACPHDDPVEVMHFLVGDRARLAFGQPEQVFNDAAGGGSPRLRPSLKDLPGVRLQGLRAKAGRFIVPLAPHDRPAEQ